MDALKRAEESKQGITRQNDGPTLSDEPGLALEPTNTVPPLSGGLPDLAQHLDAVDADLQAVAPPRPPPRPLSRPPQETGRTSPPPAGDQNRAMAQSLFTTKSAAIPSRAPLGFAVTLLVLVAIAIAIYFWLQWRGLQQPVPPPQPSAAVLAAPAVSITPSTATSPIILPAAPRPSLFGPAAAQGSEAEPAPVPSPRPAPPASETAPPIRLTRTTPTVDPHLQRGWQNMQANALDVARREYELALRNDPNNVDTLLGLAAIAQRQGRHADAEQLVQRAIDADPRDAAALAAHSNQTGAEPQAAESRLKTLLAAQPESPTLNFALGNFYAAQGRWPEAQPAYFNAFVADSDNPDYLFNLAVSLDHLRQNKSAAEYYRLALEAADRRPPAFDRERLRQRLGQLAAPPER